MRKNVDDVFFFLLDMEEEEVIAKFEYALRINSSPLFDVIRKRILIEYSFSRSMSTNANADRWWSI